MSTVGADEMGNVHAKISEMNIPLSPNATSMFNVEHACGNYEDAISYVSELEAVGCKEV